MKRSDHVTIGVVIHDHEKYEGHTLEDQFVSASVNALAKEIEREGKFLMLKAGEYMASSRPQFMLIRTFYMRL